MSNENLCVHFTKILRDRQQGLDLLGRLLKESGGSELERLRRFRPVLGR